MCGVLLLVETCPIFAAHRNILRHNLKTLEKLSEKHFLKT